MYTDPAMKGNLLRGLSLLGVIAVFATAWRLHPERGSSSSLRFRVVPPAPGTPFEGLVAETDFASGGATPSVHCASAVEISRGRIYAVWYGGSREGAGDVAIWSAVYDPESHGWSPERRITTREETGLDEARYVKKLGNVVLARAEDGRLWLFYVSVSLGGWSGSAVNARLSTDEGVTWGRARRLVTSPFLNVSTLVKGPVVFYSDGSFGLPVYHELLGKFGELLRLSPEGILLGKTRLSYGRTSLQPVLVPFTPFDAIALFRRSGSSPPRMLSVATRDAGAHWTSLEPTPLRNPDSAVFAEREADGSLVVAFNDSETDRANLTLALSEDRGRSFRILSVVEPPGPSEPSDDDLEDGDGKRFAYPWLVRASNGDLHLLYTWNRRRIVHVVYHRAGGDPR
jgi:predicted neuraminidase